MTNEINLSRRLEVGVKLPGSLGISRELPDELINADVDRVIKHVLDSPYLIDKADKDIASSIRKELGYGEVYTVFVARGNEEYKVSHRESVAPLFEFDPVTHEPQYQKLILTVSSPREGGY